MAQISDAEVYKPSMPRPVQPKQRGFILSATHFRNLEDVAGCVDMLKIRFMVIDKKATIDSFVL